MTINERVKTLRKTLKLTQIEFGEKIGVSQGHLTSIENGKKIVTDKTAKVICLQFRVNEDWLINGEGDMFAKLDPTSKFMQNVGDIALDKDELGMAIVEIYKELTDEHKQMLAEMILKMAAAIKKKDD